MGTLIALLATWNESRFIVGCLDHLAAHGADVYVIDNESTDGTLEMAHDHPAVIGCETMARHGRYRWSAILERKAELAATLRADWFLHVDADERHLPPVGPGRLSDALINVGEAGYNSVNFTEFVFVPTLGAADHDHASYEQTMRWYYPFVPRVPNRVNAWRAQETPVDLVSHAGHEVLFPGRRLFPESFPMRHYLFLSLPHGVGKYAGRPYDPDELARGWHRARAALGSDGIELGDEAEMRRYVSDDQLDSSGAFDHHPVFRRPVA